MHDLNSNRIWKGCWPLISPTVHRAALRWHCNTVLCQTWFHIDPRTGQLTVNSNLTRENVPFWQSLVIAVDDSTPRNTATGLSCALCRLFLLLVCHAFYAASRLKYALLTQDVVIMALCQNRFPATQYRRFYIYSASQKNPPPSRGPDIFSFFHKRLRICNRFFTHLLNVPIFARLQIFIQLSPILTKLCHIKRDYAVHNAQNVQNAPKRAHSDVCVSR